MRTVRNEQYAYIEQYRHRFGEVFDRLGDTYRSHYRLPDIISIEDESDSRVLVLAPHQDDEVLGCGGTIHRLIDAGAHVKVVYMTDGRYGNTSIDPVDMIEIRESEARKGLRALGVTDADFHDVSDLGLDFSPKNVESVKEILSRYRPNILFVPHPKENHPDHWATAQIAAEALKRYDEDITVFQYEVWTSIDHNVLVDITRSMDVKLLALNEHQIPDANDRLWGKDRRLERLSVDLCW